MPHRELPTHVIERARAGDHAAFRQVVERYQAGVFKLALKMTWNEAEAADLAQDVFLRIYRVFGKFDPARPLTPWLYKVATNVVLNHLKARRADAASLDAAQVEPAAAAPNGVDATATEEAKRLVREAVAQLSANQRAAVTLYYLKELSLKEMADALCVPESTAKVWLFRARQALKKTLEDMEP